MRDGIHETSRFWREHAERFAARLKESPEQSLVERWNRLREVRPDLAVTDFGYMPMLLEHGWAVIAIPEDGVIYTIGLWYRHGQPELLLRAPALANDPALVPKLKARLNALGARVRGGLRIGPGDRVEVEGDRFTFGEFRDEDFDVAPCGYISGFEELFHDVVHEDGGSLPVLWTTVDGKAAEPVKKARKPVKKMRRKPAKKPRTKRTTKRPARKR